VPSEGGNASSSASGKNGPDAKLAKDYADSVRRCRKILRERLEKVDRLRLRLFMQSIRASKSAPMLHEQEHDLIASDDELDSMPGLTVLLPSSSSHYLLHPTSPVGAAIPKESFEIVSAAKKNSPEDPDGSFKVRESGKSSSSSTQFLLYSRLRLVPPSASSSSTPKSSGKGSK